MTGDEYSYTFKFQFHASTIKTICTLDVSLRLLNFNSIMVQLKQTILLFCQPSCRNFNSIMVQLKPSTTESGFSSSLFQFHNGTIKTKNNYSTLDQKAEFQFHNGTIKTHRHLYWKPRIY